MLYLQDATLVDWRTLTIRHGHFEVTEGGDGDVKPVDVIPANAEVLPCDGGVVTRAFANGHHHVYSALARGMPQPAASPTTFVEILKRIWWNLDRKLDASMIRASALVAAIDAARSGCTFVIDHHSSPNAIDGSLDIIAEAFDEIGIGHLLCLEISDRDGDERRDAAFRETERYLEHWRATSRHPGLVGLHASFTIGDATLERAVDLARRKECGIHIHVAEAESDQVDTVARHGVRVVDRLARAGALTHSTTILAHALHLDATEREIVAAQPIFVAQCTESNQNNGVGRFDAQGLSDRILLGTDGMHCDLLRASRSAYFDAPALLRPTPNEMWLRLRRVHDYIDSHSFDTVGGENDLVLFHDRSPTPITPENFAAHAIYGLPTRDVRAVLRSGRLVVKEGELIDVDERRILADARNQAERLWNRL